MADKITLLQTKMMPPPQTSGLISRSRFASMFAEATNYRLILISASAGFGKTTALVQAVELLRKQYDVAWISLEPRDNQSSIFLQYFIASLQSIDKTLARSLQQHIGSSSPPSLSDSITTILNDIVAYKKEIFIVLDDYHFIQSADIQQFLEVLINLAPANFHLIVASRTKPDFPIITKNARADTLELSAKELRFDLDETRQFFSGRNSEKMTEQQLSELFERSEGWAVGLQLAALYLSKLSLNSNKLTESIGSFRDIADYLAREVLDQQADYVIEFLIKTSILQRFCAPVCDEILGKKNSIKILKILEESNLFLVPLDENRQWYRYHHFFQEFLQTQLHTLYEDQLNILYRDASDWFHKKEMYHEAVEYALEGQHYDLAADLIEERTVSEFVRGRMPQVNEWISRIPEEIKYQMPKLMLIQGTSLYHMNKTESARLIHEKLNQWLMDETVSGYLLKERRAELETESKILKAGAYMSDDRCEEIIDLIPPDIKVENKFSRGAANNILGYAYYRFGKFEQAEQQFSIAKEEHTQAKVLFGIVYSRCFQAISLIMQGDMNEAANIIKHLDRTQQDLKSRPQNVASVVDIMMGIINYEYHDLESAKKYLQFSLPKLEKVGHIHLLLLGYRSLVKIFSCQENFNNAYAHIDYMISIVGDRPQDAHRILIELLRVEVFLSQNKLADALNLAMLLGVSLDDEVSSFPIDWDEVFYLKGIVKIRILLGAGQYDLAQKFIPSLLSYLKRYKQIYCYMELLLLFVITQWKAGEKNSCANLMIELSHLLAPQAMYSLVVSAKQDIQPVLEGLIKLKKIKTDVVASEYIRKCQQSLQALGLHAGKPEKTTGLMEPLSTRELSILKQMSLGKSNAAIASELFISEGTVKWHGGNIFSKLNVKNRTAAVITAKEMKLIE